MIRQTVLLAGLIGVAAAVSAAEEKAKPVPPSNQDDSAGKKLSERVGQFPQPDRFFIVVPTQAAWNAWKKKYEGLTADEKVHYCIFQLRNESWYEKHRPSEMAPHQELVRLGRLAIPELLRALDCEAKTRMYPSRHMRTPWLVQDAALDIIQTIACKPFAEHTLYAFSGAGEEERRKIRKNVIAWWEENKGSNEVQWAKDALFSQAAGADRFRRFRAVESLYDRQGKKSYPFLAKAYHQLPKGREDVDGDTCDLKTIILQRLLKSPTANERSVFASALRDAPLLIRIDGAEGLWALGDPSGLEAMVKETEEVLVKSRGTPAKATQDGVPVETGESSLDLEYDNLLAFLRRCDTASSRDAIYKCLLGKNPYLRGKALPLVPKLRLEKAVRALPDLFDDQFVLGGSYTEHSIESNIVRTVPPRRVCDEAAEAFGKVVPDAPRFAGTTAQEQQASIDRIKRWWKENSGILRWDEKRGMLVLPAKR
jgi:hypothetical protein